MKKPKICFITPFFLPTIGGVETHIYNVAKELIKLGYEVEVFTSDMDRDKRIEKKYETIDSIKVSRFRNWLKISFAEMFFPGVFKAVRNSDADIFHVHTYRHLYNFIFLFTKKPVFLTPHWPIYKGQRSKLIQMLVDVVDFLLGKYLFKNFSKICAVTDLEHDWIESFDVEKSKIITTPNCLPSNYMKQCNGMNFRKKYKLKDSDIAVITVSRVHKSKGIDQLIKVTQHFPKVKFFIIGKDGGFTTVLKDIIRDLKLKNIIITGRVSEKEKIEAFAGADIFCSPSHFEAFCITILEAMSQGCAVLTSNQGGMPWVVGDDGLIFEDYNLTDLKNKLSKLINSKSLREKYSKAGMIKAKTFTWDKTAKLLNKEYKKLIKK